MNVQTNDSKVLVEKLREELNLTTIQLEKYKNLFEKIQNQVNFNDDSFDNQYNSSDKFKTLSIFLFFSFFYK